MRVRCLRLPLAMIVLISIFLVNGCTSVPDNNQTPVSSPTPPPPASTEGPSETPAWMDFELTNVVTGETFRISDFKGKPVLLESFAVWCPTCLRQQQEMQKMQGDEGDDIVHVSLDTDPNEDEGQVREHAEANDLNWYFAVAPIELTNALRDEFGLGIISASSAPVVLICADQSSRFLGRGVKSAETLLSEVAKGCR